MSSCGLAWVLGCTVLDYCVIVIPTTSLENMEERHYIYVSTYCGMLRTFGFDFILLYYFSKQIYFYYFKVPIRLANFIRLLKYLYF